MRKSMLFTFLLLFVTRPTILSVVSSVGLFGFILQFKKTTQLSIYTTVPHRACLCDYEIVKNGIGILKMFFHGQSDQRSIVDCIGLIT